ncbi:MAG: hypothetical protein KF726_10435 [Anaerolineae bacterium]|nr:hypothetical protein [Anaerolineae bacterium]
MRRELQRVSLWLLLTLSLISCSAEAPTLTPTPVAGEAITFYVGTLDNSSTLIGLLVSATRFRAAVCTDNADQWRSLNTWIRDGLVSDGGAQLSSTTLTAQIITTTTDLTLQGSYHANDGTTHAFSARRIAATEDYERDEQAENRAIYSILGVPLIAGGSADFYVIVANIESNTVCAMLLQNGTPLSRVAPIGQWQAGFTPFALLDLPDDAGTPVQWSSPRLLSKVVRIAFPQQ